MDTPYGTERGTKVTPEVRSTGVPCVLMRCTVIANANRVIVWMTTPNAARRRGPAARSETVGLGLFASFGFRFSVLTGEERTVQKRRRVEGSEEKENKMPSRRRMPVDRGREPAPSEAGATELTVDPSHPIERHSRCWTNGLRCAKAHLRSRIYFYDKKKKSKYARVNVSEATDHFPEKERRNKKI